MRTAWLAIALVFLQGCAGRQRVRVSEPEGARVKVLRSLLAKGRSAGKVPHDLWLRPARIYPATIRFEGTTLRGGIVCVAGGPEEEVAVLAMDAATVREALGGSPVTVRAHDGSGNLRALLKVSTAGVPLDDAELAAHGRPISRTLTVAGNVLTGAGAAVLFVAVAAIYVIAHLPAALI